MKVTLLTLVLAAIGFAQYPPPFCPPMCPKPPLEKAGQQPKPAKVVKKQVRAT